MQSENKSKEHKLWNQRLRNSLSWACVQPVTLGASQLFCLVRATEADNLGSHPSQIQAQGSTLDLNNKGISQLPLFQQIHKISSFLISYNFNLVKQVRASKLKFKGTI
jgi:hypothetical protein